MIEKFLALDEDIEGSNLEKTFRILSYLLYDWCTYKGTRKPLYDGRKKDKSDIEPMPVIHFEKFAVFIYRLWNFLFGINKTEKSTNLVIPSIDQNKISFPFPFLEVPAKHGRRLMRYNGNKKRRYLIELIYEIQTSGIMSYFEISTPKEDPCNPNNYETTVSISFLIPDKKNFLGRIFNSFELEIIDDLGKSCRHLGASEIRALGTHENEEKTLTDIKKEYLDMIPHISTSIQCLENKECFFKSSYDFMSFADEAFRKSIYNQEDYQQGYNLFINELTNPVLKDAFKRCQRNHNEIWTSSKLLKNISLKSKEVYYFSRFFNAIAYYRNHSEERNTGKSRVAKRFKHEFDESINKLIEIGISKYPPELHNIFIGNSNNIVPNINSELKKDLATLNIWIKENIKNA